MTAISIMPLVSAYLTIDEMFPQKNGKSHMPADVAAEYARALKSCSGTTGPSAMGYVYIFRDNRRIKIGFSTNVERRKAEIELAIGKPLKVLASVAGDQKLERSLHRRFREYRTTGEWFISQGSLRAFLTHAQANLEAAAR